MIARLLAGGFLAALTLVGCWIGGFDFNERGLGAAVCYAGTVLSFLFGAGAWMRCEDEEGGAE